MSPKRSFGFMLFCALALFSVTTLGASYPGTKSLPKKQETKNSKQAWVKHIKNNLPPILCMPNQYFVQCFNTTQQQCVVLTKEIVHACAEKASNNIPEKVDKTEGEKWGQIVASCTYEVHEKLMISNKKDLPACQAPKKKAPNE